MFPAAVRPLMAWNARGSPVTGGSSECRNRTCSTSGTLAPRSRHDHGAERAAERVERVVRAVVVIGPHADRVRGRLPRVRELLAGRDEAADPRVVAEEDAVVVGRVADAVRMHRERLAERLRGVAEVDDERVADLRVQRRAGDRRRAVLAGEAGQHLLVDERAERPLARDLLPVPVVAAGRGDVPRARACLDPVLALAAAGLRLGRGEGQVVLRDRARRALDLRGQGVRLLGGARVVQAHRLAADRAQEGGAGPEAEEGATCRAAFWHSCAGRCRHPVSRSGSVVGASPRVVASELSAGLVRCDTFPRVPALRRFFPPLAAARCWPRSCPPSRRPRAPASRSRLSRASATRTRTSWPTGRATTSRRASRDLGRTRLQRAGQPIDPDLEAKAEQQLQHAERLAASRSATDYRVEGRGRALGRVVDRGKPRLRPPSVDANGSRCSAATRASPRSATRDRRRGHDRC